MINTKDTKSTKKTHEFDSLSRKVIGCCIEVHRVLGPGLLESAYQQCLAHELHTLGIPFEKEKSIPVDYKSVRLECGFRADFVIDSQLIVELKSIEQVTGVHHAQLMTYMKLIGCKTGLLVNFNKKVLKDGIKRFVL